MTYVELYKACDSIQQHMQHIVTTSSWWFQPTSSTTKQPRGKDPFPWVSRAYKVPDNLDLVLRSHRCRYLKPTHRAFPKIRGKKPQNGCFIMENPYQNGMISGVPLFSETPNTSNQMVDVPAIAILVFAVNFFPSRDGHKRHFVLLLYGYDNIASNNVVASVAPVCHGCPVNGGHPQSPRFPDGRVNPCSCAFHRSPKLTHGATFELLVP